MAGSVWGSEDRRNSAVQAARLRRQERAAKQAVQVEWFIDEVCGKVEMTMEQRVRLATEFVRSKVVWNISQPVTKTVKSRFIWTEAQLRRFAEGKEAKPKIQQYTVISDRSKPGEFPKADTTQLMKSIFTDVKHTAEGYIHGFVGTPLDYGWMLEVRMNRSFLVRTLQEEADKVRAILSGPIKGGEALPGSWETK
jgi:hypothetical protein